MSLLYKSTTWKWDHSCHHDAKSKTTWSVLGILQFLRNPKLLWISFPPEEKQLSDILNSYIKLIKPLHTTYPSQKRHQHYSKLIIVSYSVNMIFCSRWPPYWYCNLWQSRGRGSWGCWYGGLIRASSLWAFINKYRWQWHCMAMRATSSTQRMPVVFCSKSSTPCRPDSQPRIWLHLCLIIYHHGAYLIDNKDKKERC